MECKDNGTGELGNLCLPLLCSILASGALYPAKVYAQVGSFVSPEGVLANSLNVAPFKAKFKCVESARQGAYKEPRKIA